MESFSAGGHCAPTASDYTPSTSDEFYSPEQVKSLLGEYETLGIRPHRSGPDPDRIDGSSAPTWDWMPDGICLRLDIERALDDLRARSEFHYQVVVAVTVFETRFCALARQHGVDWETVKRANLDGIETMSRFLGWDGDVSEWRRGRP